MAHVNGTTVEIAAPLILFFSTKKWVTLGAAVLMVGFHLFITSTFPLAVPLEWNMVFGYTTVFLFAGFPNWSGYAPWNMSPPWLALVSRPRCCSSPCWATCGPDKVSFLPSMRQYAGNWASALWAFAPGAEEKLDRSSGRRNQVDQFIAFGYDREWADITMQRTIAWRTMHSQGRGLFSLLLTHLPDIHLVAVILLDKNPTPTSSLHLWLRVFPESKALIALRDPRDVIVSCFFQNLALTPLNANFLSLERAVKHYADLMDVWLRLRELGGFQCEIAISPDGKRSRLPAPAVGDPTFIFTRCNLAQRPSPRQLTFTYGEKSFLEFAPDPNQPANLRLYYLEDRMVHWISMAQGSTPQDVAINVEFDMDFNRDKMLAFDQAWRYLAENFHDPLMSNTYLNPGMT